MNITIESPAQKIQEANEITIEQYLKRRIQHRRRVAKRKLKAVPLFAVEEMQGEFPGYTYDEFIADVTRKTRKGKSFRRPKPKAFDWKMIAKDAPELFAKCRVRTKTKAVLFGKHGDQTFTIVVRSYWFDDQGQRRLDSYQFMRLFQGPLKDLLKHPSVRAYDNTCTLDWHDK